MTSCRVRTNILLPTVMVANVFATMACTGQAPVPPPSTSAPTAPPPISTTPEISWRPSAEDDEAACSKTNPRPWRPDAEPYTGPGPHYIYPIEVQLDPGEPEHAADSKNLSTIAQDMVIPHARIPLGWQLIACVYDGQPARPAGMVSCHFDSGAPGDGNRTFPLHESRYEVIVRETRTGTAVQTFDVPGTASDAASCPRFVVDRGDTIILRGLEGHVLGEALRLLHSATK